MAKVSSLFQTPQRTAAIEARAAFKRIAPEVKNMLAHAADTLGQEPGYRKLSPRDRDGLLREKIAAAFVSELCVRQRLDGEDKAYAHAYFSLLLGVKAPEDSSEATQKLARYVSPAEQARGKQFLDLLVEDARSMGMNRTVDVELDLNQPKLQGFVSEQVRRAIIENGEMTTGMRGKPVNVSGTFWRDFTGGGATEYWLDDGQGVPERLSADTEAGALASTQRLLALIGKDDHDVAKLLTHVASQNVSTVAMAMVNQAFFEDRERFAPLRTPQGQPVAVCLSPNVKFTFRKLKDGKVELHYVGKMAPPKDIDSRIKNAAKVQDDAMGNWKLLESSDYSLKIDFRMVFEPNGEWTMGNPRIQARNMHRIAE